MSRLADRFEKWIETFLSGNLDRRAKVLSWITLILLTLCLGAVLYLLDYPLTVKNRASGQLETLPIRKIFLDH